MTNPQLRFFFLSLREFAHSVQLVLVALFDGTGERREARCCANAANASESGNCRRQYPPSNATKPSTQAILFLALCASTATENMKAPTCGKGRHGTVSYTHLTLPTIYSV